MSRPIIEISNLSKKYRLGAIGATTLRESFQKLFGKKNREQPAPAEAGEFWALRDINLTIQPGEVVGVIGRNGAGKSTLLKILSRITEPTSGRVVLRGRVASLLEVGTGFQADLTGRENIFLNGAILGMRRAEIAAKFDEIVAFAEIDRFLDTPVKHYSSGMYVRLAFAVAAHLEPEILIVDEVLAVGDQEFQKKCLGKMKDVAGHGRTVLFVSHNLQAIEQLTSRCVLLHRGQVALAGPTAEAIERYLNHAQHGRSVFFDLRPEGRGVRDAAVTFESLAFERERPVFAVGEALSFVARIRVRRSVPACRFAVIVSTSEGTPVGSCFGPEIEGLPLGMDTEVRVTLPFGGFAPGFYSCTLATGRGTDQQGNVNYDVVTDTLQFEVSAKAALGGTFTGWHKAWGSIVLPALQQVPLAEAATHSPIGPA